jgi:ATP-dependent helicase HrpB
LDLPIHSVLPEILRSLADFNSVVIQAPTGAGKTTIVPPALLRAGLSTERNIVMVEPRRVAARAAARRMATLWPCRLGETVGYQVRFDRKAGQKTRLLVATEGILLRQLQTDPFLEDVGLIVFDEFHERRLGSDLALAMARQLQLDARPDLRLVVMSATLDAEPVAKFLDCPVVTSEGRLFPVDIQYLARPDDRNTAPMAASGTKRALGETTGDVLVFLPGVGEIKRTARLLRDVAREQNLAILPLYGALRAEEQDAALGPISRRKVVLATNVAETSVTIDGIEVVVDTGLARIPSFDAACGLNRLELVPISRSSADQRAGRAGRQRPGLCLRLWTAGRHAELVEHNRPEIRRLDLSPSVLELLSWGEPDPKQFGWFEPPDAATLGRALELLRLMGATDDTGITALGRQMAQLPLHPRLSRLVIEGHRHGVLARCCLVAAMLSERGVFRRSRAGRGQLASDSDTLDRVRLLERFDRDGVAGESGSDALQPGPARAVLRARRHIENTATRLLDHSGNWSECGDENLKRALFAAYPDRLARRRKAGSPRGVLMGGRGVRLAKESAVVEAELFVCVDLDAGARGQRAEALVRQASAFEKSWLSDNDIDTWVEVTFDPTRQRVISRSVMSYRGLTLAEQLGVTSDPARVAEVLAEAAAGDLTAALPIESAAVAGFLGRVRFLAEWMPELELPAFGDEDLLEVLPSLCAGRRSFEELRRAPLLDALRGTMTHRQLRSLKQHAPARLTVPSGREHTLRYGEGRAPILAVRIQEMFGLADTPRVANGRVPILLHLLAPNMRPQQITDDLRNFWASTYSEVRKELRRRYPKHDWPEDPSQGSPRAQ